MKKESPAKYVARWIIANTVFVGLLVYGIGFGVNWAANIVRFLTVFYAILGVLSLLAVASDDAFAKKLGDRPWPIPGWLDFIVDAGVVMYLAAVGMFGYATLYLIHTALLHGVQARVKSLAAGTGTEAAPA